MIPANVILPFNGLNSAIPAGWARETTLDGKYPKAWGASVAPNNTGGSNTHTHTGNHTHTMNSHTHDVSLGDSTETFQAVDANAGGLPKHTHASLASGTNSGGGLQSATVTWSSVNQEPPYYTVIFIKPTGTLAHLTSGILAYFNRLLSPSNWKLCDGNAGAPDIRGKYLKGALTGANAGGTGGVTSHVHTITHSHTESSHSHIGTSRTYSSAYGTREAGGSPGDMTTTAHTHTYSLLSTTEGVDAYTKTDAGSADTIDLAYKKMAIFTNSGGGMIKGLIAMWLGATADIPIGWFLCDGNNGTVDLRDKFIKAGNDITQNGLTGGANTHTHSSVLHSHTAVGSHSHSLSVNASTLNRDRIGGAWNGYALTAHTHSENSVSSVSASWINSDVSADTVDHQPAHRTVAYIEYQFEAGGSFLYNLV